MASKLYRFTSLIEMICVKFMLNPMRIHTTPDSFRYLCKLNGGGRHTAAKR